MKKLISFKVLKSICGYEYSEGQRKSDCDHIDSETGKCNPKTCPVWKKLKEEKK